MKIQFVIGDIGGHGGTERVVCELASVLAESEAEYQIAVLSLFGSDTPYFNLAPAVNCIGLSLQPAHGKPRRFINIACALYRHCRDADVVILADSILFAFCGPWAWRLPSRFVCWEHFNLTTDHGSWFRAWARRAAAWCADAVVVLTERDAAAWRRQFRLGKKVRAICNPIPRFPESPASMANRGNTILAMGRLTEQKGFDLLLEAWSRLGKAREGWHLRIVGSGRDETKLKRLAEQRQINDSVTFAGLVRHVEQEYRAASVYVMSSRWEGLGMTLLEAQHFGVPCVSTDCPVGPWEILNGTDSGLLVPVEDPQALADAMARLMVDPGLRATMGAAALANASRYQPERIWRLWQQLFNDLLVAK